MVDAGVGGMGKLENEIVVLDAECGVKGGMVITGEEGVEGRTDMDIEFVGEVANWA